MERAFDSTSYALPQPPPELYEHLPPGSEERKQAIRAFTDQEMVKRNEARGAVTLDNYAGSQDSGTSPWGDGGLGMPQQMGGPFGGLAGLGGFGPVGLYDPRLFGQHPQFQNAPSGGQGIMAGDNPNRSFFDPGQREQFAQLLQGLGGGQTQGGWADQFGQQSPGQSYSDVVARGGGGINPVIGYREDGTPIRLMDRNEAGQTGMQQQLDRAREMGLDSLPSPPPPQIGLPPEPDFPARTREFIDANNNGIDDRDETFGPDDESNMIGTLGGPAYPSPPSGQDPFASNVTTSTAGLDPTTQQLLFGLGGQGGFIPGAMRAAERTFFDAYGRPVVVPQEVAGFSPDQLAAMELARGQVGLQFPYIQDAEREYRSGIGEERGMRQAGLEGLLESIGEAEREYRGGVGEEREMRRAGLEGLLESIGETERMGRGAVGDFGGRLGGVEDIYRGATGDFGGRLGESESLLRGTTGGYDQGLTSQFYDPYEERVVEQTIDDILERGDQADMAQRARDIQSGGESAFGSRARLGAEERRESLGRGLGEAIGGLRSSGFRQAQGLGLGEFARQRAAERAAASGLSGLFGQRLGAQQALGQGLGSLASQGLGAQERLINNLGLGAGRAHQALFGSGQAGLGAQAGLGSFLSGLGGQGHQALFGAGQAGLGAQAGLGNFLTGLGGQAQGAGMADINMLSAMGGLQQQLGQRQLDAHRQMALQAQQAPLAQYQSLLPFMQMVPSGRHTTQTTFTPRPSPLQAGLAAGLGAFGAFGNFMNQQRQPQQPYPYGYGGSGSPYV